MPGSRVRVGKRVHQRLSAASCVYLSPKESDGHSQSIISKEELILFFS